MRSVRFVAVPVGSAGWSSSRVSRSTWFIPLRGGMVISTALL